MVLVLLLQHSAGFGLDKLNWYTEQLTWPENAIGSFYTGIYQTSDDIDSISKVKSTPDEIDFQIQRLINGVRGGEVEYLGPTHIDYAERSEGRAFRINSEDSVRERYFYEIKEDGRWGMIDSIGLVFGPRPFSVDMPPVRTPVLLDSISSLITISSLDYIISRILGIGKEAGLEAAFTGLTYLTSEIDPELASGTVRQLVAFDPDNLESGVEFLGFKELENGRIASSHVGYLDWKEYGTGDTKVFRPALVLAERRIFQTTTGSFESMYLTGTPKSRRLYVFQIESLDFPEAVTDEQLHPVPGYEFTSYIPYGDEDEVNKRITINGNLLDMKAYELPYVPFKPLNPKPRPWSSPISLRTVIMLIAGLILVVSIFVRFRRRAA